MKFGLEEFWGRRVAITWGSHFIQGVLCEEKSTSGYITLIEIQPYVEYRIDHDAIDSIGIFIDKGHDGD